MATTRKRDWQRPVARPITTSDSRADVPDTLVQNLNTISQPTN